LNLVSFLGGLNNPNSIEYDPVLNGLLLTELGEAKVRGVVSAMMWGLSKWNRIKGVGFSRSSPCVDSAR